MPNPSTPSLILRIRREGETDVLTIRPESMEWVQSTEGADMLRFTVADPEYLLIDHPMLIEDMKTEVEFRYGYNATMSPMAKMRYFNQRPEFPEGGGVRTTIICYDLSVFLNFEIEGKTLELAEKVGVKEIIELNLREAKETFGIELTPEYHGAEFENQFFRVARPNGSLMHHFASLRKVAKAKGVDETLCEVYVEGDKLHFHPPRRRFDPIGAFAYFSEHPGARLLEFTPEVNLDYRPRPVAATGINTDVGEIEEVVSDGRSGEKRPANARVAIRGTNRDREIRTADRMGDSPTDIRTTEDVKLYTVTGTEGATLLGILEQFPGASYQRVIEVNGLDPEHLVLTKGDVLKIPLPQQETTVRTAQTEAQAKARRLAYESRALNATATVLGNPRLSAGWPADFFNVGAKYSGRWYIRECSHIQNSDGYRVSLNLTREGITYGDGIDLSGHAEAAYEPAAPIDAEIQNPGNRPETIDISGDDARRRVE